MTSRPLTLALLVLLSIAGCSRHASQPQPASRLTEVQRDSAIARSSLPGASTVGRALEQSGQGANRAAQADSMTH